MWTTFTPGRALGSVAAARALDAAVGTCQKFFLGSHLEAKRMQSLGLGTCLEPFMSIKLWFVYMNMSINHLMVPSSSNLFRGDGTCDRG